MELRKRQKARNERGEGWSLWEAVWVMLLVMLPVAVNRLSLYVYAVDRRLLLHGVGLLLGIALMCGRGRIPAGVRWAGLAGVSVLGVRLVSGLCGVDPWISVLGSPYRDGGWLTSAACGVLVLTWVLQCRTRVQWERVLKAVSLGAVVPVVVGVLQVCGVPILGGEKGFPEGRVWSTFGNAILFGSYLVGVLPTTVWCAVRAFGKGKRVWGWGLCAWVVVEMWLLWKTGSRGPLLGLGVAGAVSLLLVLRARGARLVSRALSWAMVAGLLLVLGGVQVMLHTGGGMSKRFNTVEMRLQCYRAMTEEMFGGTGRPWLGYGQDRMGGAIQRRLPVRYELVEGRDHVVDSTHSATMDALGGSGVLGMLALAGFWGAMFGVVTPGMRRRWMVLGLAIAGAAGMMALWGVHTWALGAATGCVVGMLWAAGALTRGLDGMGIVSVAMVVGLWVESQFGVYSAMSSVLLHVGLAGMLLGARGFEKEEGSENEGREGGRCWGWAAVAVSVVGCGVGLWLRPGVFGVEMLLGGGAYWEWLEELMVASRWVHGGLWLGALSVLLWVGRVRRRWLVLGAGVLVLGVVALTEWGLVERDMRVACAKKVSEGGRRLEAKGLLEETKDWGRGPYAAYYGMEMRPILEAWARASKAREEAWKSVVLGTRRVAEKVPYEARAHLDVAASCMAALEEGTEFSQGTREAFIQLAERSYRVALELQPGSNVTRQRLAKLLYVYKHDRAGVEAVFEQMLALEPENPVVLSMRAQFALSEVRGSAGEARVAKVREAYVNAERALRSPSLSINGVDIGQVKKVRDAAKRMLVEAKVAVPELPRASVKGMRVQAPVFEESSERHLGQALLGAGLALVISLVLVGPVRWMARRLGWVDAPAARKVHREPTPLLGGLAIVIGVWVVALCVPGVPLHGAFQAVLGVGTGLAIVGVVDDRWPLPWQIKIAAQLGAAVCLYALGVRVQLAWLPGPINLGLTVFWLVGVTNAVNFLDNMNGLSNGLVAWTSGAVAAIGLVCGEWDVAAFALALTGACVGFLRGNNPWRGSIFMGDTGSLFLGFVLASMALLLRFPNNENWVTWLCPVLLLAVPVFDMTHVCVARLRRGCNPFSTPGKDHTSHLFERMGLSRPMAVLAVHGLVLLCAVATWLVSFSRPIVAYGVASLVLAGAVFLLGYFELRFGVGGVEEYRAPQAEAKAGFTLLELLMVMAILGVLFGIGAPMISSAQRQARQADCRSNLRQFGIALANYRSDHNALNPPWMSNLYPEYIDGKDIFVCKSDKEIRKGTSGYDPIPKDLGNKVTRYDEIRDFGTGSHDGRNNDIEFNSYFYEFSAAECEWDEKSTGLAHDTNGDGKVTWSEAKEWQLRYGDQSNGGGNPENPRPYSTARMPIIRCWHHWNEDKVRGFLQEGNKRSTTTQMFEMVLNVGYAGNVFASPPWWEGRPDIGE